MLFAGCFLPVSIAIVARTRVLSQLLEKFVVRSWRLSAEMLPSQQLIVALLILVHTDLSIRYPLFALTVTLHQFPFPQHKGSGGRPMSFACSAICGHAQKANLCHQFLVQVGDFQRVRLVPMRQNLGPCLFSGRHLRRSWKSLQQAEKFSVAAEYIPPHDSGDGNSVQLCFVAM